MTKTEFMLPEVGPIFISSPANTTYTSGNNLMLSFEFSGIFDTSIYQYAVSYAVDGAGKSSISELTYSLPEGDGPLTPNQCDATISLDPMPQGTHQIVVYATFTRISSNTNWPSIIYDNGTVIFTVNNGIPPAISNISIVNQTYLQSNLTLSFATDKAVSWSGYSLDGAQNVTVNANTNTTTLDLTDGPHYLTIYANDTLGNMGASQTVNFTVEKPQTKVTGNTVSTEAIAIPSAVVCLAIGILLYGRDRKASGLSKASKNH